VSPEVRNELLSVLDRYVSEVAVPSDLTRVADTILVDGTYTESLGELTYLHGRSMETVGPVFESAIRELDLDLPSVTVAANRVVRECARQISLSPEAAYESLVTIRELQCYSDVEVDAGALAYMAWIYEGSEELFEEKGQVVTDENEWQRLATRYVTIEAQEWLANHPEESRL
jgi:hypothetical protein